MSDVKPIDMTINRQEIIRKYSKFKEFFLSTDTDLIEIYLICNMMIIDIDRFLHNLKKQEIEEFLRKDL